MHAMHWAQCCLAQLAIFGQAAVVEAEIRARRAPDAHLPREAELMGPTVIPSANPGYTMGKHIC